MSGKLYVVATPIGHLSDITLRAIDILKQVDWIAAEDTRHSQRLLSHYEISVPLISLHDHNESERISLLLAKIKAGKSGALISDAGTPLVHDPGFLLVRAAKEQGISVVPIPGACAAIAALSVSGLSAHRFLFMGFLPTQQHARRVELEKIKNHTHTLIFYESPHRVVEMMNDLLWVMGEEREAVIAREITKIHESVCKETLLSLKNKLQNHPNEQKGEFVILVSGDTVKKENISEEVVRILKVLLKELPVKQASKLTADITGESKNKLYPLAVGLMKHL